MQAVDSSRMTVAGASAAATPDYRPEDHFFVPGRWINDPNGLVLIDGVYHLFFQFNPEGPDWGNMSWGHAISHDLLNWEHRPVALPQRELAARTESIFSGCCVLDRDNVSGLGSVDTPALLAFYTSHYSTAPAPFGRQAQSMAFSLDQGETWQFFSDEPLIQMHQNNADGFNADEFRDPKVFYHEASGHWIMVLVLATDRRVIFYRSRNLLDWSPLSTFSDPGDNPADLWEVPDLIQVPLGETGESRWVLLLSVNTDGAHRAAGSTQHYFVGDFDGEQFFPDQAATPQVRDGDHPGFNRLDWGRDFYAAVSFHNDPDPRPLLLGWMNNWAYANTLPDYGFRGQMSLARRLTLQAQDDGALQPCQQVIRPVRPDEAWQDLVPGHSLLTGEGLRVAVSRSTRRIDLTMNDWSQGALSVTLHFGEQLLVLTLDADRGEAFLDRTTLNQANHPAALSAVDRARGLSLAQQNTLTLFLDRSSIEVLGAEGAWSISQLIFPQEPLQAITLSHSQTTPVELALSCLAPDDASASQ